MVRDIGSIFYQLKPGDPEFTKLPRHDSKFFETTFSYFYSGRHGIHAILQQINKNKAIKTIWLPSYFCHNVINSIRSKYNNVEFYKSSPFLFDEPIGIPNKAKDGEVVLLNNYWGLQSFDYALDREDGPIVIEDHSHGWLSEACVNSKADYCISSIRKSYPIPLGAVVWRPNNKSLEVAYQSDKHDKIYAAYDFLEEAQSVKRDYIKYNHLDAQSKFLTLLAKGEELVCESKAIIKPHNRLASMIDQFFRLDPIKVKHKHLHFLLSKLETSNRFNVLSRQGFTPFGLLLLFNDMASFNGFKEYMLINNIYPANLWPNNDRELHHGLFYNIHIDFRYTLEDMEYIVDTLNTWINQNR